MAGRSKGRGGCWTCRLRRKRCDGAHPVCRSCIGLEVTCHRSETKPEWMDRGAKQKEMTLAIKTQIKDRANGRRERADLSTHNQTAFSVTSLQDYERPKGQSSNSMQPGRSQMERTSLSLSPLTTPDPSLTATSILSIPHDNQSDSTAWLAAFPGRGLAWEMDFLVKYLDYVFPFLFPFYRPPLVGTSRAWLLSFLKQDDAVFHSMLGFSSFFFTVELRDMFPGERQTCKSVIWGQVVKQADLSFQMVQDNLMEINRPHVKISLLEKAHFMETIIQLLIFDLFIGKLTSWDLYLTPALTLFENIWEESSRAFPTKPGLSCILEQIGWPPSSYPGLQRPLWNSDQAAFRFFTAILLFYDILAGTSLGRAPRLHSYHSRLLADLAPEKVAEPVDLSSFVGCQNWVLQAVGDIAALDAWKEEMKGAASLVPAELVERGDTILQALEGGLAGLDAAPAPDIHSNRIRGLQPYYHAELHEIGQSLSVVPSRVWAYAAQIYLAVVVSGWTLSDPRVRRNVARVLTLLQAVKSAAQLRTFAWPFCVAGCLAEGDQEQQEFDNIITGAGDLQLLSAVREAGRIMKAVWIKSEVLDNETWDIAACFRVLGTPVLLV